MTQRFMADGLLISVLPNIEGKVSIFASGLGWTLRVSLVPAG
jgi:hypothetical protein